MKLCYSDCVPLCDNCRMFNYNGYGKVGEYSNAIYVGNGYCVFHEKKVDPEDECFFFICRHYKEEHKPREIK